MGRVALVLHLVALAACATLAAAARTAVVLESIDMQQTHSKFFQLLEGACVGVTRARVVMWPSRLTIVNVTCACSPRTRARVLLE